MESTTLISSTATSICLMRPAVEWAYRPDFYDPTCTTSTKDTSRYTQIGASAAPAVRWHVRLFRSCHTAGREGDDHQGSLAGWEDDLHDTGNYYTICLLPEVYKLFFERKRHIEGLKREECFWNWYCIEEFTRFNPGKHWEGARVGSCQNECIICALGMI